MHDHHGMYQGFHVVDGGRFAKQSGCSGIRRFVPGLSPLTLDGFEKGTFFATNISSTTQADMDAEVVVVLVHQLMEYVELRVQFRDQKFVLSSEVNVAVFGSHCPTGNGHTTKNLSRYLIKDFPVLKSPWFSFVGITNNVFYRLLLLCGKPPLQPGGKSSTTPALQVRFKYLLAYGVGIHAHDLRHYIPAF